MKPVLQALLLVLLTAVVLTGLGIALFIGFGALMARWLHLSLFHASALAIGAALAIAAIARVISDMMHIRQQAFYDDFDDDDDELDPIPSTIDVSPSKPDFSKVGRNDYCPCGSGKKFKNCCENAAAK
jgi:hypothetical protein